LHVTPNCTFVSLLRYGLSRCFSFFFGNFIGKMHFSPETKT